MRTVVVYVHGLWLKGREAAWLRGRLSRQLGAETCVFSYPSVTAGVSANAQGLDKFLSATRADTLHIVGHSLGGLVILKLFESAALRLPPGRIVLLGSPVCGSRCAQRLAQRSWGRKIMGRTVADALLVPRAPRWPGARELGVIAGDLAIGLGRLVGTPARPNDGTVLVEETHLEGATEHLRLPVSHSGMLFSSAVASQTAAFLRNGRFER